MAAGDRIETNIVVLTGPEWMVDLFDGFSTADNKALIQVTRDADNRPIISANVITDTTWDIIPDNLTNPETGETKRVREWLTPINYVYIEPEEI